MAKRLFDVLFAVVLVPLVVPLLALCAFAIYVESPGPVVFRQLRTGLHGRRFRMFKFRTMVVNAEELKASLQHLNILPPPDFKIIDDPRVTRVGRFLRKTSLDELPQILNVLKGDMSFVGPRPTSFAPQTYSLWHTERLEVRPGITGLWQVTGRNRMTFDERLRLDIAYVRSMSMRRDLGIIFRTVFAAFSGTGA